MEHPPIRADPDRNPLTAFDMSQQRLQANKPYAPRLLPNHVTQNGRAKAVAPARDCEVVKVATGQSCDRAAIAACGEANEEGLNFVHGESMGDQAGPSGRHAPDQVRPGWSAGSPSSAIIGGMNANPSSVRRAPRPIYIRIPRPGERCPYSGLSRSKMLSLVLPSEANGFLPSVESFVRGKPGTKRGIRLVVWASLEAYIRAQPASRYRENTGLRAAS